LDAAAEYRIAMVFPDTSPRGEAVENIEGITNNWDFGKKKKKYFFLKKIF
jgi:hypothetical protein